MKLEVERYHIKIIPENIQDEIYLENVLGLKLLSDRAVCYRINVVGTNALAYVETCSKSEVKIGEPNDDRTTEPK